MHDIESIEYFKSFQKLFEDIKGSFLLKMMFFSEHLHEGTSIAKLINEIIVVAGFEHFIVHDDMICLSNGSKGLDFIHGALQEFAILM